MAPATARRHLTDEAVGRLARSMVLPFAEETPGADAARAPRTAALPVARLGRAVAGLAEAMQVRLAESTDAEQLRSTIGQPAQALSALRQLTAATESAGDPGVGVVALPPGLLHRAARYLEAAAALTAVGVLPDGFDPAHAAGLADTFRTDAAMLRYYARE